MLAVDWNIACVQSSIKRNAQTSVSATLAASAEGYAYRRPAPWAVRVTKQDAPLTVRISGSAAAPLQNKIVNRPGPLWPPPKGVSFFFVRRLSQLN